MTKVCVIAGIATVVFFCTLTTKVSATPFIEYSDAGQTLASAQLLPADTVMITGSLHGNDVDMFLFGWGGGEFYADSLGSTFDSQLFLFDFNGVGIQSNDDGLERMGAAFLQTSSLAAGNYFIGISGFDNEPQYLESDNSYWNMFPTADPCDVLYGPYSNKPLSNWNGDGGGQAGGYKISLRYPTVPVPEPATLLLLGTGLFGFVWGDMKRKQATILHITSI